MVPTTVYAACASNNLADSYLGNGISGGEYAGTLGYNEVYTLTDSAYDCCVASLLASAAVEVFFWLPGGGQYCFMEQTTSAAAQPQAVNPLDADIGGAAGSGYVIGNSYSGAFIGTA